MAGGRIEYTVGYKTDKTGLNELKASLQQIQQQASQASGAGRITQELQQSAQAARQLESILDSAWNSKLQQFNLDKVNQSIKTTYGSVANLKKSLEQSGTTGAAAYNKVASSLLNTNLQLRQSSKLLDDMATTMANTVKWGIASSIMNTFTGSVQKAWGFTKQLDTSLNNIRIVTEKSSEDMEQFAKQANKAAKELGASTTAYTDASLIYFQQGLEDNEVTARAEVTLKAANVTGQSAEEVSEQLTAVWNGYKVSADEAELYVDKLAAVAATTASDLEELSSGMSKVASAANSMGVDIDQLNAQLATIVSVTRQAPESVGTALKTIYARMGDLAIEGEDEFGVSLGEVSGKMKQMGIEILDQQGNLRDMGLVIEETAAKWDTWTEAQRQAAAVAIAGKRQYNNLIALFENWDMYTEALETSADAAGTLQKQQDIYMESTAAHLKELSTEAERTYKALFDTETANGFIDLFKGALENLNDFIEGIGGGTTALIHFGATFAMIFNKQIANSLLTFKNNFQAAVANFQGEKLKEQLIAQGVSQNNLMSGSGVKDNSAGYQAQLDAAKEIFTVRRGLTQEQYNETLEINKQIGLQAQKVADLKQEQIALEQNKNIDAKRLNIKLQEGKIDDSAVATANLRIATAKRELAESQEYKTTLQQILQIDARIAEEAEDKAISMRELQALAQSYQTMLIKTGMSEEQAEQHWNEIVVAIQSGKLNTEQIEAKMEELNGDISYQNAILQSGNNLLQLRKMIEEGQISNAEELLNLLKQQNSEYAKSGQSSMKAQKGTSIAMGLVSGLSVAIGSLGTELDESADKFEKANARWSAASGIIGGVAQAVGTYFGGPLVGAAVGMIGQSLVGAIGQAVTGKMREEQEELEKIAEENAERLEKTYEKINDLQEKINNFSDLDSEWQYLVSGVNEYGENLSLTNDEYNRYLEICESAAKISEDVIDGYNAEGQAIMTQRDAIEKLNEELDKQYIKEKRNSVSGTNKKTAIDNAKKEYNDLKDAKDNIYKTRANEIGDVFSDYSFSIGFTHTDIAGGNSYDTDKYTGKEALEKIISDVQLRASNGEISEINKNLFDKLMKDNDLSYKEFIENYEAFLQEFELMNNRSVNKIIYAENEWVSDWTVNNLEDKIKQSKDIIEDYETQLKAQNTKIKEAAQGLQDTLSTELFYGTDEDYQKFITMSSTETSLVQKFIQNFEIDPDSDKSWKEQYEEYLTDTRQFQESVMGLDEETQTELKKLQDPSNYETVEEYEAAVTKVKEAIKGLPADQKISFWNLLDFSYNKDTGDITKTALKEAQDGIAKAYEGTSITAPSLSSPDEIIAYNEYLKNYSGTVTDTTYKMFQLDHANQQLSKSNTVLQTNINNVTSALSEFQEEGEISKETLTKLEAEYEELAEIRDKGSHEYLKTLRKIREQEEAQQRENLQNKLDNLTESAEYYEKLLTNEDGTIKPNVDDSDIKNFAETLDDIINTRYELEVAIKADLDSDIDSSLGIVDEYSKLTELISEDLTVSMEEAQELISQGYGNILKNATTTAEGEILLNKSVANSFIDSKEAELTADKESMIQQLQNQLVILRAQREVLTKKIANLEVARKATDAESAHEALTTVQTLDAEYNANLIKLNEELTSENEAKEEKIDINEDLFTRMGGMYIDDAQNQANAAAEGAKEEANVLQQRIDNVEQLFNAYEKVKESILHPFKKVEWADLKVNQDVTAGEIEDTTTVDSGEEKDADSVNAKDLKGTLEDAFKDDESKKQYQATIDALIRQAKNDLADVDADIAAREGSISLLRNAATGLNKFQSNLGSNKNAELLEDEIDLYHDINLEIEDLNKSLEKLQTQQDKLYGSNLLKNLYEQTNALEQQNKLYEQKLALLAIEAATKQKELEGYGVTFDKDTGDITNYNAILSQKLNEINSLIQNNAASDIVEAKKQQYEDLKEAIERYDDIWHNEMPELQLTIDDNLNEKIEKQIEAFEYEIQLKLDIKDAERDWNDFKRNMTIDEDDILGNTRFSLESFKSYLGDDGTIATLLDKNRELMDQYNQIQTTGTSSIYGDNMAALMEDMQENQEELMSAMEEQKDLLDEIEEAYVNMLDAAQEAFDEQIAQYEAINEVYSHGLNVINVLYGEDAYADMEGFYQKQMDNNNQMIDMQRRNVEFYKRQLEDTTLTDEQREEVQRKLQEAQAALHSSVESQIDLIINKYTNAINKIFQELENKMTNGKGLSYIQEEWDLLNQNAEMYLDQVNSAYEIEKLAREYNKAIDATDSLSAQRKLNELMEQQLKGLREKEKLTQYDVDRANALLDVELKRIALEEAQQNKSKMRLRRDASGNYSYQFVSDEEATAEAQQELADAQNSLYNLDKDALQENQESALNMWTEFKDKYIEIMSDVTLSDEEREARLQQIREQYGEMYNNLLMQNEDIRKNLEASALDEMKELNLDYVLGENGLVPTWDSGVQQMMEKFAGEGGLLPTCSEAFGELSNLTTQYDADLATLEANAGYSLGNIAGYTAEVATQMESVLQDNDELIAKYEEELRQLGELRSEVSSLMGDYNALTTAATAAANAILNTRKIEADVEAEKAAQEAAEKEAAEQAAKTQVDGAAQQLAAPSLAGGSSVTVKTSATHFSRDSGNGTRMKSFVPGSTYAVMQVSGNEVLIGRGGVATGWVNKTDLVGFATGGYTGDWADKQGKLAVLHQKELVLNSQDTKNILQAVDIVRRIDGIMESIMGNAFNRVNAQLNGLNSMNIPVSTKETDSTIEQHIEINADFPGVEKASEIISAFENLTNMATQYAFKTDR